MAEQEIYLDNAATTKPMMSEIAEVIKSYCEKWCYNPSAKYSPAMRLAHRINQIRATLTKAFGSETHRCLFTSSGSEAANIAILRSLEMSSSGEPKNIVCATSEHPCVIESVKRWESIYDIRWIQPNRQGGISTESVLAQVDKNTALVSVAHINNVTGAKNDIESIAAGVKKINGRALFHSDGVQAYLKYRLGKTENIDYYTVSAHKVHALPGTGAIFYNPEAPLRAWIHGGGQENGLRSGTENVLGILAFGKAVEKQRDYLLQQNEEAKKIRFAMLDYFNRAGGVKIVSPTESNKYSDYILTIAFPGVSSTLLVQSMDKEGIYVANGAACSSRKENRIPYLDAETSNCLIRLSTSKNTKMNEAKLAANTLIRIARSIK